MNNLIVPVAGKSTRFPGMRPKFLLTHPEHGDFMAIAAILGLDLSSFDKIYFVTLQKYEDEYQFLKGFKENLGLYELADKTEIIFLDEETKSQPETVYKAIKQKDIKGSIFIKDCDNYFEIKGENTEGKNSIAFCSLTDFEEVQPNNKSYIKLNKEGIVENIIEKEIISTTFCCGGYGFENAEDFCGSFEKMVQLEPDLYISDIIYDMILAGKIFKGSATTRYSDWGTAKTFNKYKDTYKVLFCDIDGIVVNNASNHLAPYIGESKPLEKNIARLKELDKKYNLTIIFTTSRPESYRNITENELARLGLSYNHLIMNLPHCQRILLNDFAASNPFESARAINLKRNADDLEDYL